MATLYARKNRLWLSWFVDGVRFQKSTGLMVSERAEALRAKERLERELRARKLIRVPGSVPARTVAGYKKKWIEDRTAQRIASVHDDETRLKHTKELDQLDMAEVRPRHIRDLILRLRREGKLAPRTIRHVFAALRRMFEDARIDELIIANPCTLKRGDLPGKRDKDPTWRAGAIFTRSEVERLISDPVIPEARRTLYAILFAGGLRIGEVAALKWSAYQPDHTPLGKLIVAASFHRKTRKVKGVKTDVPREVPVHPVIASALMFWWEGGWERQMGRPPKDTDLLLPAPTGNNLRDPVVHANLLRDLVTLGLRPRRVHDARRTFVSLALEDGAAKEILKLVSHGPSGDIISLYTTLSWTSLCGEVSKLRLCSTPTATPLLHRQESQTRIGIK